MSSFTLCRVCIHFNPANKTCVKAVTGASRGHIQHAQATTVRLDKNKCGIDAKWFVEIPKTDDVFDLLDM